VVVVRGGIPCCFAWVSPCFFNHPCYIEKRDTKLSGAGGFSPLLAICSLNGRGRGRGRGRGSAL